MTDVIVGEGVVSEDRDDELPVESLDEALVHLRRPFEPAAVRWKVQHAGEGYGIVIAYIDARLVTERLNRVVGGEWEDEYRAHSKDAEECALTVFGRTRRDVGTGSGQQAVKSTRSDSFKRAGVKFGIGVSIYALKAVRLQATTGKEPVLLDVDPEAPNAPRGGRLLTGNYSKQQGNRTTWYATISPEAEKWLAHMYARWLEVRGLELFGPVLAHGDEEGAAGLEGEEQRPAPDAPAPEPGEETPLPPRLEDERAQAAHARIQSAYAEIKGMNGAQIPPRKHRLEVEQAQGSHELLEELAAERERVRDEMAAARGQKPKPKATTKETTT